MEVAAALSSLEDLSASPFGSATLSALARRPGKHSHISPLSSKGLLCCISGHVFCSSGLRHLGRPERDDGTLNGLFGDASRVSHKPHLTNKVRAASH